ncbi:hypothetical protein N3K66_003374 [Trichothecium roseum]|uniref:Uncharacterized protein n=1 Tax=Trichothecium roseum TaxID=47278 RepID=A0ACC0V5X5_9HYPO|nr:hypothetical protein N3K66_003374 [Trichothecium roseum]
MVPQTTSGFEPVKTPNWSTEDHPDLLSRDKVKVKDAVKKYLAATVRNDWVWPLPESQADAGTATPMNNAATTNGDGGADLVDEMRDADGYQADGQPEDDPQQRVATDVDDDNDDADSVYSVVSDDQTRYKTRTYWESDPNDDDEDYPPDTDTQSAACKLRDVRRRNLRKEAQWNEGLACFEARRNAWTNAKTVRMKVKPETSMPTSPSRTARRFSGFFRKSISGAPQSWILHQQQSGNASEVQDSSPAEGEKSSSGDKASQTTAPSERSSSSSYPVQVIIPVAAPILPPANPLRQSIQQSNYLQVYDKLVANSLTPSCPINLADMIGACVSGWKRDGEWPPRPTPGIDPAFSPSMLQARKAKRKSISGNDAHGAGARRRSITGFLVRGANNNNDDPKTVRGGLRQSFSRALGLTPSTTEAPAAEKK